MHFFTRTAKVAPGNTRDATEWATGITEQVNQITDLGVTLWASMFGPDYGTLSWSCFVPDLPALEQASDKLLVDNRYVAMADMGASMTVGLAQDVVATIVHGEPDPNRSIEYATVVQAACRNGSLGRGLDVGARVAAKAEEITGTPTLFCAALTGAYGSVAWLTGHESIGALEGSQQKLMADPSWQQMIDEEAGPAYADQPFFTTQTIWRRIA